jgi:proline racemase
MRDKQDDFRDRFDYVRTSLMQEPRGHRNMLGAVLTDPVTPDGDIGMIFLSPQGFFDMCGDSTFSATAALVDSGMFKSADPNGELRIKADTVAGRVDVHVRLERGEPMAITFDNVASFSLGTCMLEVEGAGVVEAMLGYGGLLYVYVQASQVGIPSLREVARDELLQVGTRVLRAAKKQVRVPVQKGAGVLAEPRPMDLITLWEPLSDRRGARVANFYAPLTTGRTPSGTGLSARVAVEFAAGRLGMGETYVHESLLGLQFSARATKAVEGNPPGIIPSVTARSFLMGTAEWVLHPDDPFRNGFVF